MFYIVLIALFAVIRYFTVKYIDVLLKVNPYITCILVTLFLMLYFIIYKVVLNISSDNSFILLTVIGFTFLGTLFSEKFKLYWKSIGK